MSADSASTTPQFIGLGKLVDKTMKKDGDRYAVKRDIKNALLNFPFFKKGLKIKVDDPSYKLRYRYALDFWKQKTRNGEIENRKQADDKLEELKNELNDKFCVHPDINDGQEVVLDEYFSQTPVKKNKMAKKNKMNASDLTDKNTKVCYVTCKCENTFYVKSTNVSDAEVEIDKEIFNLCEYKFICPGDEIQVIQNSPFENEKVFHITKYVHFIHVSG